MKVRARYVKVNGRSPKNVVIDVGDKPTCDAVLQRAVDAKPSERGLASIKYNGKEIWQSRAGWIKNAHYNELFGQG